MQQQQRRRRRRRRWRQEIHVRSQPGRHLSCPGGILDHMIPVAFYVRLALDKMSVRVTFLRWHCIFTDTWRLKVTFAGTYMCPTLYHGLVSICYPKYTSKRRLVLWALLSSQIVTVLTGRWRSIMTKVTDLCRLVTGSFNWTIARRLGFRDILRVLFRLYTNY